MLLSPLIFIPFYLFSKVSIKIFKIIYLFCYVHFTSSFKAGEYWIPQIYLGLMVRIWASLGLNIASFSIFYCILSFFLGKYAFLWLFAVQIWGWQTDLICPRFKVACTSVRHICSGAYHFYRFLIWKMRFDWFGRKLWCIVVCSADQGARYTVYRVLLWEYSLTYENSSNGTRPWAPCCQVVS